MRTSKLLLTLTIVSFLSSFNLDAASPDPSKRKSAEQEDEHKAPGMSKRAKVEQSSSSDRKVELIDNGSGLDREHSLVLSDISIVRNAKDKDDKKVLSVDEILSKTETTHLKLQNIDWEHDVYVFGLGYRSSVLNELLKGIAKKFTKLKSIDISAYINNDEMQSLSNINSLEKIRIHSENNLSLTGMGVGYLAGLLPRLTSLHLDLKIDNLYNSFFKAIGKSLSLKEFKLTNYTPNLYNIEEISQSKSLETLHIKWCSDQDNNNKLTYLSNIKTLKSLKITVEHETFENHFFNLVGLNYLLDLPVLESIEIEGFKYLNVEELKCLSQIKTLKSITLSSDLYQVSDDCLDYLCRMQSLEKLELSNTRGLTADGERKLKELYTFIKNKNYLPTSSLDSKLEINVQQTIASLAQDAKKLTATNRHLDSLQPRPLDEQILFNNFDFVEFYPQAEQFEVSFVEHLTITEDFFDLEIYQDKIIVPINNIFNTLSKVAAKRCLSACCNTNLETMTKMLHQNFFSHFCTYHDFACKNYELRSDEKSPHIEVMHKNLYDYQDILNHLHDKKLYIASLNQQLNELAQARATADNKSIGLTAELAQLAPDVIVLTFYFFQQIAHQHPEIAVILEKTMRVLDDRTNKTSMDHKSFNIVDYKANFTDTKKIKENIENLQTYILYDFIAVFNATVKDINELCKTTQKELDLSIIKRRKKGLQSILETKLCAITTYALALCEKNPVAAFKITSDIKAVLMPIDKEIAHAAHAFIIEALNKFKQEIREALLHSFTFNFAYLDALAAKSLALCSEEKDAINWLAQKVAFTDEKEWSEAINISKKYADKLSKRNEALIQEIKDPVELAALPAKLQKLQNDIENQTSDVKNQACIDFKIIQGQLLTQQAILEAEDNLTKLAQNKEQSLQDMLNKAEKIAHEIKKITRQVHPRFVIETFKSSPQEFNVEMNKRIDKSLGIIKQSLAQVTAQKAASSTKRKRHPDEQEES